MRTGLIAKALSRRFRFDKVSAGLLARIARSPSYRAPSAANLHDPKAFPPPGEQSPLEAFGAKDLALEDGTVIGMSLSGRSFISNGAALLKKVPLRELRLVAVQPFMAELARCPHLASIRRLDLSGNRIGAAGMAELAASPHLGGLRQLNLSGNDLGPEGTRLLATAPWLAVLERLEIADNGIRSETLGVALAGFGMLSHLDLSRNPLGPEGAVTLARWAGIFTLKTLNLSACHLGPEGARDLLAGDLRSLHHLDLSFNGIGPDGIGSLPHSLRSLDLGFNDLGDEGIARLTSNPPPPALTSLDLSANRITSAGLGRLADSGWLESIKELNLSINPIEDDVSRYNHR